MKSTPSTSLEELRRLKAAIARATEYAAGETNPETRARCFVAYLSGSIANICGDAEGEKLFNLIKVDE